MLEILCDSIERGLRPVVIYGLIDPAEPDVVRYVGSTTDPEMRFRAHCTAGSSLVREWVESVVGAGRKPTMVLLERCTDDTQRRQREAFWHHHYVELGQADLNIAVPRLYPASRA